MTRIKGIVAISIAIFSLVIDILLRIFHPGLTEYVYHVCEAFILVLLLIGAVPVIKDKWIGDKSDLVKAYPIIINASIVCIVSGYYVLRYDQKLLLALSVLVSSVLISTGWFTQAILQKIAHRRQHTVNTLMQSRLSETYQTRLNNLQKQVKGQMYVSEATAIAFCKLGTNGGAELNENDEELLRDSLYIANYFEYLAISIKRNDLDNELLYDCWNVILSNIERKLFYLLVHLRKKDQNIFCNFAWLCEYWHGKESLLYKYHKNSSSVTPEMLGTAYSGLKSDKTKSHK